MSIREVDAAEFDATSSGSAADAYRSHHDEIRRRHTVAESTAADAAPVGFERPADAPEVAFVNDAQRWFVWSASHRGMAPRAKDARHCAVRVYGCFPSHEEAVEHAQVVAGLDKTCSLLVSPTHDWTMVPSAPARLADGAVEHVKAVLAAYDAQRAQSTAEFQENVDQRRAGRGAAKPKAEATDATADATADAATSAAPRRLGRDAEVRDQSVVAVSVVRDTTQEEGEPLLRVYGAFESAAAADAWARCAGDHVTDHDIDIVSTCVWLFVNDISPDKIPQEVYRSKELGSIIQNQKKQPQMVEQFKKWREESTPTAPGNPSTTPPTNSLTDSQQSTETAEAS